MKNESAIRKMFAMFTGIYQKRFEASEAAIPVWDAVIGDIPEKELLIAAKKCCASCKFPPTPAEVLENVESSRIEKAKQTLTVEERDVLEIDPAAVWAGAHRKMLTNREKYKEFLNSQVVPRWIKDAFEAVGGIDLCTMGDDSRLYPRFEKAWNEGKAGFLGQMKNPQLNFHETPKIKAAGNLVKTF